MVSAAGTTATGVTGTLRPAPESAEILSAYKFGRSINEFDWTLQAAYLVGVDLAGEGRLEALLNALPLSVRRVLPERHREAFTNRFREAAERIRDMMNGPWRGDQLTEKARQIYEEQCRYDGDDERVRRRGCSDLLDINSITPTLVDQALDAADPAVRCAVRLGMHVDGGLRPSPGYAHFFTPAPPEQAPVTDYRHATPDSGCLLGPPKPNEVLANTIPEPGTVPLARHWFDEVDQRWRELCLELRTTLGEVPPLIPLGLAWGAGPNVVMRVEEAVIEAVTAVAVPPNPPASSIATSRPEGPAHPSQTHAVGRAPAGSRLTPREAAAAGLISASDVEKADGISSTTLHRWTKDGKVAHAYCFQGGKKLLYIDPRSLNEYRIKTRKGEVRCRSSFDDLTSTRESNKTVERAMKRVEDEDETGASRGRRRSSWTGSAK
jgi:hypothetical protein